MIVQAERPVAGRNSLRNRRMRDRFTDWATQTRAAERVWMLRQLVHHSTPAPTALDAAAVKHLPHGSRVVAFAQVDGLEKACKAAGVDFVDCAHALAAPGARAVSFPIGDAVASRLEDLTSSWDLQGHGFVVRLTERIEVRFTKAVEHHTLVHYSAVGSFPAS